MTSPVSSSNPYNPADDPYIQSAPITTVTNSIMSDSLQNFTDMQSVNVEQSNLSFSLLAKILGKSTTDLSHTLREALLSDADIAKNFFQALAHSSNELLNLYNVAEAAFLGATADKSLTGPAVDDINNTNLAMANAIQTQQNRRNTLNTASTTYQAAVDAYNSSTQGTDQEKADALADLNNAREAYNQAVTDYNTAVTNTNTAVTNYRAAVAAYQDLLTNTVNPNITKLNTSRTVPIPLQTVPADQLNWTYTNGSQATLLSPENYSTNPPQSVPGPATVPTIPVPPAFAADITNPNDIKFEDKAQDFIEAAAKLFGVSEQQLRILAQQQASLNPSGADYKKKIRLNPESDVKEDLGSGNINADSPGGPGLAAILLRIRKPASNAILSQELARQTWINSLDSSPQNIYDNVLTFTLQSAVQAGNLASYSAVAFLNNYTSTLPPDSPAVPIASALGYSDTLVGLLNKPGLLISIQNMLSNIPSLSNLTALQKEQLAQTITAQVSNSLVNISISNLQNELNVPAVGDTLKVAGIIADPNTNTKANLETFKDLNSKLQNLVKDYQASGVATPLAAYLQQQLAGTGLSPDQVQRLSQAVADRVASQGLGESPSALSQINVGEPTSPEAQNAIFNGVVTFTAAASLKQDVQASLISSSGAAQALNLADPIVSNLYGVTVSLSQSQVSIQESIENRPTSIVQIAANNYKHAQNTSAQESLANSQERFADARSQDTSLDSFQRMLLDPGVRLYGLMYEGTGSSGFERKSVDIKVA